MLGRGSLSDERGRLSASRDPCRAELSFEDDISAVFTSIHLSSSFTCISSSSSPFASLRDQPSRQNLLSFFPQLMPQALWNIRRLSCGTGRGHVGAGFLPSGLQSIRRQTATIPAVPAHSVHRDRRPTHDEGLLQAPGMTLGLNAFVVGGGGVGLPVQT